MNEPTTPADNQNAPMAVASGAVLGVPSLTLTMEEIKDLALFAGFRVAPDDLDEDNKDTEITIEVFPEKGIKDDDGILTGYRHLAYLAEYPEEGAMPLGTSNDQAHPRRQKSNEDQTTA